MIQLSALPGNCDLLLKKDCHTQLLWDVAPSGRRHHIPEDSYPFDRDVRQFFQQFVFNSVSYTAEPR
jgi:hypothetical protein